MTQAAATTTCQIIQHTHGANLMWPEQLPMSVDLAFADPPYNYGLQYADDASADRMSDRDYWNMLLEAYSMAFQALRPGGMLWWVCPQEHIEQVFTCLSCFGMERRYLIVWYETFSQYNRNDLTKDYRFIIAWVKSGGSPTFNPDAIREPSARMIAGDKRAAGPRIPGMVWQLRRLQGNSPKRVDWHPAQMGPEVLQRIVKGWSNPGDTVMDLFAGSGSLGVECQALGRHFIGLEASPTYCAKMRERLGVNA